jgi:MOSC domain-containing protein YiiM
MSTIIEGIFLSPGASLPMQSLETGTLVANRGLEGDRYHSLQGTYSHLRLSKVSPGEREPGRQLTLLSAESVEAAFAKNGLVPPKSLGDLRRNIVVRGCSAEDLLLTAAPATNGQRRVIQLGPTCRLLVHRHCVPCMYNERKNGIPGMMEAIWNESGVSCQVLVGGSISVGDSVQIIPVPPVPLNGEDANANVLEATDPGNQPPGYYVPPSKRTTKMVMGALQMMRETKKQLAATDPEGVARVEVSYQSVGLSFWPRDKK